MKRLGKLWTGIAILVLLSPLGLILPARFGAGSAWGEWSADELHDMLGYLPEAFKQPEPAAAPLPDYAFRGQDNASLASLSLSYIVSAVVGISAVLVLSILVGRLLAKKEEQDAS